MEQSVGTEFGLLVRKRNDELEDDRLEVEVVDGGGLDLTSELDVVLLVGIFEDKLGQISSKVSGASGAVPGARVDFLESMLQWHLDTSMSTALVMREVQDAIVAEVPSFPVDKVAVGESPSVATSGEVIMTSWQPVESMARKNCPCDFDKRYGLRAEHGRRTITFLTGSGASYSDSINRSQSATSGSLRAFGEKHGNSMEAGLWEARLPVWLSISSWCRRRCSTRRGLERLWRLAKVLS